MKFAFCCSHPWKHCINEVHYLYVHKLDVILLPNSFICLLRNTLYKSFNLFHRSEWFLIEATCSILVANTSQIQIWCGCLCLVGEFRWRKRGGGPICVQCNNLNVPHPSQVLDVKKSSRKFLNIQLLISKIQLRELLKYSALLSN